MNQYIGKSRGGNTTKIHAIVDGLGNPVCFELSGGQVNDNTIAIDLLSNIDIKSANILGDKAYGTKDIRFTRSRLYNSTKDKYYRTMGL